METTRHFTATVYVVHEGATALHAHPRLDLWLPPGGHIQRDELPHEAALREAREETGLEVTLHQEPEGPSARTARPLPRPVSLMLEDINVHEGDVGHQHVDFIYVGEAAHREIDPAADEVDAEAWEWFDRETLKANPRLEPDVRVQSREAIQLVED